jgi:VCBS repeat-containing protein
MATNTGGGTTASLSNTPQAKDDSFNLLEDYNAIAWLDVMANDLGGNAKILWSLDDSATDAAGATDLIGSDIGKVEATSNDTSLNGAKIWICDGKVGYDASTLSASFRASLQALAVGQTLTDSFTYAIRMSNGTLSWGTATVIYTGTNDGPDISVATGDSAAACLTETNSTLSTNGTLTVVDPDTADTVAVSITGFSKSGNAGSLSDATLQAMLALTESSLAADTGDTHNLHWSFGSTPQTFDYLAAGECLTLNYTVTANDGHGGTDTQTISVTIKGTNDGPAVVSGGTLNGGVEEESGTYTASGSFGFTDVDSSDVHTVSATPGGSGYLGTLTPSVSNDSTGDGAGTVSWSFSVSNADLQFLGEGETRTQTYTVTVDDGHGGTASQTVTIVLTGDEDPIVITSAAQSKSISEDGTSVGGSITFNDVDLSDTHTASAAANAANTTSLGTFSIDATVNEAANAATGSLGWSYAVDNSAAQYLAVGESVTEKYDVTFNDAHGSIVTETVTVTITGSNDGPDIRAIAGDTASHGFNETDSGLSTSGTLTVTDPDTTDTVDTSAAVAVSGNQGSLSNSDLLAMFHITGGTDNDLAANTGDANNLSWSFDSGSEAFDFLAEGQVLTLTYTLTSVDGHGGTDSQDVTITITGTNDAPELSASVTSGTYTDTAANDSFGNLSGTLSTVDPDSGDTATYSVNGGALDNSHLGYDTSASSAYGTLYLDSLSGAYLFVPNDTAIVALKTDDSVGFTLTVTDSQGASDSETLTINIDGTNDTPELSATLTSATFTDTANDDSFIAVTGDLSSTDRDSPETATYGVIGGASDNSLAGYDTSKASAFGTLYVDSASGNYTFVPNDAAIEGLKTDATLFFSLTVTDGSGATDSKTLTINLDGANDTPDLGAVTDASYNDTAADDSFANITGTLTSTDRDSSDTATYSVAGQVLDNSQLGFDHSASSAYGTLYLDSSTGAYKFVPNDGAIEGLKTTDHVDFTVSVTDGSGASDSDTLTITLNGVNDTPDAPLTNSVTTDEDTASSAVAIGASDRDASEVLTYSVKAGEEPSIGGVSFDQGAGTFTYTPDSNANGSDSFTIVITDADGATTEQVVSVTVNPVNDAPESASGSGSTDEDVPLSATLPGATDVDGDSVTYALDTDGANGSALVNADGTFTYTPDENFNGSDSFSFTVSDGHGGSNTYTYDVTVNPVNDAPESANGSGSTDEDTPLSGGLPGATDVDGDSVTYALDTDAVNGSAVVNADGTFTYTPDEDFNGSDSFSFTVSDGHGGSNTYTYDVTINPVNDAPVANDDSFGTAEDTPVTFDVRSNDSDVDGDALSVTKINGTAIGVGSPVAITGGSISLGLDGQLTYTPTANFNGTPSFTYTLSDGHGGTSVATVNLTVTAVDDAPVNTLPATFSTNEDTSVQLSGLSVADVDAGSGTISVTLGVGSGSLTAANGGGVTVRLPPPTSMSPTLIALALPALKVIEPSSLMACVPGTSFTGASLTAAMLIVLVSVSLSGPPLPVLPPSLVVIVSVTAPFALATGT